MALEEKHMARYLQGRLSTGTRYWNVRPRVCDHTAKQSTPDETAYCTRIVDTTTDLHTVGCGLGMRRIMA
jgi:hypothetical protein